MAIKNLQQLVSAVKGFEEREDEQVKGQTGASLEPKLKQQETEMRELENHVDARQKDIDRMTQTVLRSLLFKYVG